MKPRIAGLVAALVVSGAATVWAQWETPNRSFHNATSLPLEGRHLVVPCESCHLRGVYKGTPNTCMACHWIRRQDDRSALRLGSQCEQCHRPTGWTPARWDHGAMTGMPLGASHRLLGCDTCHSGGQFKTANVACVSCHRQDYDRTSSPNHAAAGFPTACEACHRASDPAFDRARFDHQAAFPLVGRHAAADCAACHRGSVFAGTPRDCAGCHRADYDRTQSPNHLAAGFPMTCEACHRPTDQGWRGGAGAVNHNAFFPLVGVHATQACAACHQAGRFRGTPRECIGCHRTDYERTQAPNHVQAGFPTACESCHRATDPGWRGATFNHAQFFPLVGDHARQPCESCHAGGRYRGTPRDCVGCHRSRYDATRNPDHRAAGFPTSCQSCHRASETSWTQGRLNHTWFPLRGPHAQDCRACHLNAGSFREFSCTVCHARGETDEEHRERAGYRYESSACYACHPNGQGD
jgi:hypothetical protein